MDIRKCAARTIGSFSLACAGYGGAAAATGAAAAGQGPSTTSFALGLTILTVAHAIGRIHGHHPNSVVTLARRTRTHQGRNRA